MSIPTLRVIKTNFRVKNIRVFSVISKYYVKYENFQKWPSEYTNYIQFTIGVGFFFEYNWVFSSDVIPGVFTAYDLGKLIRIQRPIS